MVRERVTELDHAADEQVVETDGEITSATMLLYFLYEISDAVDLQRVEHLLPPDTFKTRSAFKHGAASYFQLQNPPVVIIGEPLVWRGSYSFQTRIKFYDYGVVSVTLQAPFAGSWRRFIESSAELMDNSDLKAGVTQLLERWLDPLRPALIKPAAGLTVEEYAVFTVHKLTQKFTGQELAERRAPTVAQLLRGERAVLSDMETSEVMSGFLSYHPSDLLVVSWNAAFIFDCPA